MRRTVIVARLISLAVAALACTPKLTVPRESIRISGTVQAEGGAIPVEVSVYERCSPHLYFFAKCPGRFLGEAKIARPGPFLVDIDTEAAEVSVIASRGLIGQEDECSAVTLPVREAAKSLDLKLAKVSCPLKRSER